VTNVNESRYSDFKWKPPEKNSIDFYVEFEKDKDGKIITAYDNSYDDEEKDYVKDKPYKICKLFCGQRNRGTEVPVLFREEEELYYAYIFVTDGEVRDVEDNIISDKTVVEFYYNNNTDTLDRFKWVALRTRYDKTESVARFGRKYGNAAQVANKIWRSILNPVLMIDLYDLSVGNYPEKNIYAYDKKISQLKSKITHELIITATSENIYFQKITDLAKPMRSFVNWLKSNMIYTYCHPMYQDNRQLSVLDIGCGKGQDIMKFYYSMVSFLVAIDVDREGLVSGTNGAISRYNQLRTKKPNFPKMYFIQADATAQFDVELQHKALNVKRLENEEFFKKFFSKDSRMLFDRINCQLAVHYMLRNADCWTNFKNNLNNHLRNGGYFLASTFDAEKVMKLIGDKDKATQYYIDENGKSQMLFEIVKKYISPDSKTILGTGNAIDVYISWFSEEGRYLTEYLVDSRFFVEDLKNDCGLELVDSDNFGNQVNLHEAYITEFAKYEETDETRKFLADVAKFYEINSVNEGCKIWNALFRYYVFRKVDKNVKSKQTGGDESVNFSDMSKFIVPSMKDKEYKNKEFSFINGIHHVLKNHKIIPDHVSARNLFDELGVPMQKDDKLEKSKIGSMIKNINIEHTIDSDKNINEMINGFNVFIVERDCNDDYDVELIQKSKKVKSDDLAIIMMKEGTWYVPVYHIDPSTQERVGLFSMKHDVIQQLMNDL
jgi:SAM-dependent methyltransferase